MAVGANSNDSHTEYLSPAELKAGALSLDSSYDGIGACVSYTTGVVTIVGPFRDSPAENAGVRQGDTVDRRSVRLGLSAAGLAMLATVVDDAWGRTAATLPAAEQAVLSQLLTRLLSAWQHARHGKTFGVCHSCRHFRPGQTSHQCGLTGEALSDEDSARICREHSLG